MNYYISDLHLGHKNVISLCNRPFASLEEMDERLTENWNDRVKGGDTVYIVGDLVWQTADAGKYLERLKGKKILIYGNHDEKWLKSGAYDGCFTHVAPYLDTRVDNLQMTFCHYPMLEWKASRKEGSKKLGYHVYGHIHNGFKESYTELFKLPHALNAGADINGFAPVTFDELKANNEKFKLSKLKDPVDRAEFLASAYHLYKIDRAGKAYIEHLRAVAAMLDRAEEKTVAYLHDTLEDTSLDVHTLTDNFTEEVVEAVKVITKGADEDYLRYAERVAANPLAARVKLADLTHNMDLTRLKNPQEEDFKRKEKYKRAYDIIKTKSGL